MIKNKRQLLKDFGEAKFLVEMAEEALEFLQPENLIKNNFKKTSISNLKEIENIYVVGAGKATYKMAKAINALFKGKIKDGVINVPVAITSKIGNIRVNKAAHPYPDENGLKGAKEILNIAKKATDKDLLICLISGGGSALMPLPTEGLSLADKTNLTKQLLASRADIHEINTVRKHISAIKGGRLAANTKAKLIGLYISDVLGDKIESIASGPTVADKSKVEDALKILKKYNIDDEKIIEIIKNNESPKKIDKKRIQNFIIGSNRVVLKHLQSFAERQGYKVEIFIDKMKGEAKRMPAKIFKKSKPGKISIFGGETVVKIIGEGQGGRNQEMALSSAKSLPKNAVFMTLATDGVDGVTDEPIAGAIISQKTIEQIKKDKINIKKYLDTNDSYNCLKKLNCLLKTGPSGTNVGDIAIILRSNS